jgi:hypothetical protein
VCREKEIKGVDGMETSIQMRFDCIQTSIQVRFVARKRYSYCDPEGEKGIRFFTKVIKRERRGQVEVGLWR